MITDIVPGLLENIERDFNKAFNNSQKIKRIREAVEAGTANYQLANEFAIETVEILVQSCKIHINSYVLPEGRMYFNIADKIITPTLSNNYVLVARLSAVVQEQLNQSIGIGLKGIEPAVNQDRIKGFIDRLSSEEHFDDVAWILDEPVVNFTQSAVDETIKENVNFQGKSGLSPKIIRTTHGPEPCEWCVQMSGEYNYPNVPDGVYDRHDRCRCTVEYDPGDDRRQNVWTKEWR